MVAAYFSCHGGAQLVQQGIGRVRSHEIAQPIPGRSASRSATSPSRHCCRTSSAADAGDGQLHRSLGGGMASIHGRRFGFARLIRQA
jgi:hypothetical protein